MITNRPARRESPGPVSSGSANVGRASVLFLLLAAGVIAGCGKKGPPLAPLRLVPAPVTDVSARRIGDDLQLRFVLPTRNQNGPGPVDLGRVEVYAITTAPGAPAPANRDLLVTERLIGTIDVRPEPTGSEETAPAAVGDPRPLPGAAITFVEELTEEKLKPVVVTPSESGVRDTASGARDAGLGARDPESEARDAGRGAGDRVLEGIKDKAPRPGADPRLPAGDQTTPEAAAPSPEPPAPGLESRYPVRIYSIRGVTRSGRPGQPSGRVTLSLMPPPSPPSGMAVAFTERTMVVDWVPPVAEVEGPAIAFNVYRDTGEGAPLNSSPVPAGPFEHEGVVFGEEQCFVVRSVATVAAVAIESAPSARECVTPRDMFPPAAPAGLQVVGAPDGVSLSWDANTEPDLRGYVVLRGEAPDGTLQPLTPEPIGETAYRDTSVTPGARYVYALVAVDTATPPNTSAQSERQEVTAR